MAAVADPRVVVTLTVYNASEYLRQAIQSVLDQTFEDWQLIILDDGSSDPLVSKIICEALYDRRIAYERFDPSPTERAASVRYATLINWAIEHSMSEYVTFLCGDDYYLPDRLERMIADLDGGAKVVYGAQKLLGEDGTQQGERCTLGPLTDAFERVDLNSVMLTRHAFDGVGGFPTDPTIWRNADAHLFRRLTDAGYRFSPVAGGPTDAKHYRNNSVDARVIRGQTPW